MTRSRGQIQPPLAGREAGPAAYDTRKQAFSDAPFASGALLRGTRLLAEAELTRQFRALLRGRSAVIISHRLSTVQMADWIYVLEGGRIVERGTYGTLLSQDGYCAKLYRAQAEHYRDR